jgi:hypothetical protein
MRLKTGFVIGFGVGYVLGAKAGQERYQQIVEATRAFMDNPGVQRLTDEVNKTVSVGRERVSSAASRRVEQVSGTLAEQASRARSFVVGGGEGGGGEGGGSETEHKAEHKQDTDAGTAKKAERKKAADETVGAPPTTTTSSTTSTTRSERSN